MSVSDVVSVLRGDVEERRARLAALRSKLGLGEVAGSTASELDELSRRATLEAAPTREVLALATLALLVGRRA